MIAFIGGLATMFGILSYVHTNISVNPTVSLDTSRAFSMQFLVTNNGYLTLHNIKYALAIGNINGRIFIGSYGGPPGVDEQSPRFIISPDGLGESLRPNESETISADFDIFRMAEPIKEVNIGIVVTFNLGFNPWPQERIYHFVTKKTSDGKLYWFPKPVDM